MPDTIASYLASFHGKAMLLGSEETAGCLDCHVGEMQNVHMMKPHDAPDSSTHQGKLPDTCRSDACHPASGALVTAAAVHLELTPSRFESSDSSSDVDAAAATTNGKRSIWTIEFMIAGMFVVLIMGTFGPSALLQLLELLQLVLGRHNLRHFEYIELNDRIMQKPEGGAMLSRFSVHQRVQHWVLAISFTALVFTGFPIKFAGNDWARWVIDMLGGLTMARRIHRYSGLVLVVGAFYHIGYVLYCLWRDKRRRQVSWMRAILDLPLVVNLSDVKELLHLLVFLFFLRRTRPSPGRFGLKEKFEYFGVFWGCTLLGVTGVLMWANAWSSHYVSGRMLTVANLIHTLEAYLAILHVFVFHMIGVMLSPHVFPLHKAMFTGETPAAEMADAHAGMLKQADRQLATGDGESK
jgi:formate dehydrogenase gamma subunit